MLRLDRITAWLFILGTILMIPSIQYLQFADELVSGLFLGVAGFDCIVNRAWKRYNLLWLIIAVFGFYIIYSLSFVHFNNTSSILKDAFIELKPFIPLAVVLVVGCDFTPIEKKGLFWIAILNALIMFLALLGGTRLINLIAKGVPAMCGGVILMSALIILYVGNNNGLLTKKNLAIVTVLLLCGILCGRSKYYGEVCIMGFLLYLYKPGFTRNINSTAIITIVAVIILVVAVGWQKFAYYFLQSDFSNGFDPNDIESYARPALYYVGGCILLDYFPFGSGFASFASFPSGLDGVNYSELYYDYGLNLIYGLSPSYPNFICDAYYPMLAQFGVAGLILFLYLWIYIYSFLRILIRKSASTNRIVFIIGVGIICMITIENIAGTMFSMNIGMVSMILLGAICHKGFEIRLKQKELQENNQQQ